MRCDMCDLNARLFKTIIEDAELFVCENCKKFGKVVGIVEQPQPITGKKFEEKEILEMIVDDFADRIRSKREELNLTQKEFAKKINEKESIIHKLESGTFKPTISLTKKIGRFLKIKLTEEYEESHKIQGRTQTETFTMGDFIKSKKK
jgi:putative transcription factor